MAATGLAKGTAKKPIYLELKVAREIQIPMQKNISNTQLTLKVTKSTL